MKTFALALVAGIVSAQDMSDLTKELEDALRDLEEEEREWERDMEREWDRFVRDAECWWSYRTPKGPECRNDIEQRLMDECLDSGKAWDWNEKECLDSWDELMKRDCDREGRFWVVDELMSYCDWGRDSSGN